ncbi:hypothetical protein CHS0354_027443 [Potamilus streckersoni]|uniref:Uncharacterized protein n=1 Tax=Potamilus streckersoni TaxID=2493646 RepID=A0AAE0VL30_9BIVA|nr:hypothetical protein CHS0354_027443 [Potamilus streckersoni]
MNGKAFPYDALERYWQLDDVNMNPKRNGASERHTNRPIYYINPNSDDHRVTYILKEYGIYWNQSYMQTNIWIIILESLNIQQFFNICANDVAAKDEKGKIGNQNYMTSDEGYFACTQIPTNKGQDSMDSDVTKVFETLIVDKSIDFASRIGNKDEIDRYTLEKNVKNGVKAKEEVAEHCQENWKIWATYKKLGIFPTKNQIQDEGGQATRLIPKQMSSVLSDDWINILPDEVKRKFINRSKSIHPEDSLANLKLLVDITTSSDETGEELKECRRDNESVHSRQERNYAVIGLDILCSGHQIFWMKKQDNVTPLKLLHEFTNLLGKTGEEQKEFKNTMAGVRCNIKSTRIKLYQNVIRNETCRMMTSIDMVVSEANHLFGHERTRIFFDLLDELFYDGSAGAISDFVPNMAESDVRQHVISFFEYACDMMNRLLTLLLSYPDSKRLQKMPEKKFISLMKSVIVSSSRKTETKGEKPSSKVTKGIKLIMVDSKDFERAVGEDISEDVSERLRRGDKMIVHRIVDTRLEKPQTSDRRDKKPIHSIYFPSDCRLFIYIPTENGSYWHQSDMRRASRIHGHVEQF